jgi:hypothetical protein
LPGRPRQKVDLPGRGQPIARRPPPCRQNAGSSAAAPLAKQRSARKAVPRSCRSRARLALRLRAFVGLATRRKGSGVAKGRRASRQ